MRRALWETVCKKKEVHSNFNHIDVTLLFQANRYHIDGGDWREQWCPRAEAVTKIINTLASKFGLDVKHAWKVAVEGYNRSDPDRS